MIDPGDELGRSVKAVLDHIVSGGAILRLGKGSSFDMPANNADLTPEARIASDPRYLALVRDRQRFSWTLTAITVVTYSAFISLIAFDKPFMARPIGGGVTSIGVVLGISMLIGTVAICAVYVRRANSVYDAAIADLLRSTGA